MPLKRAVTEFGKTYKDRFALRTYPGTSVPIFIFILGWSRTKPRVTLSAQTMSVSPLRGLKHQKHQLSPVYPRSGSLNYSLSCLNTSLVLRILGGFKLKSIFNRKMSEIRIGLSNK